MSKHQGKSRSLELNCPLNSEIAILRPLNLPMKTSLKPPLPIFSSFWSFSGGISLSSKPKLSRSSSSSSSFSLLGMGVSSVCMERGNTGVVLELDCCFPFVRRRFLLVDGGRTVPAEEGEEKSLACRSRH